jgi:hypothetical protein
MKTRYVKRMTRSLLTQLSSPHSHRFFSSTTTTKSPLRHHQTTLISTRPTYSPPKFLRITTFATKNESIFDAADELREDDNKHDVASERKEPLHGFSRNVVVLTCESKAEGGKCVVYLVGTAHVSQVKAESPCFFFCVFWFWVLEKGKFLVWESLTLVISAKLKWHLKACILFGFHFIFLFDCWESEGKSWDY